MIRLLPALLVALLCISGCPKPQVAEPSHFPLRGLHEPLSCTACHGAQIGTLPTVCSGCHEPDRPAQHYGGECNDCHSEDGWELAVADHTLFPLDGGHDGPTCLDCHVEDDFGAADPRCTSCHSRPSGHFAGACEDCHSIADWGDAAIDHDELFPVPHRGVDDCVDCHLSAGSGDYGSFSCIDCHEHRQSEMDDEHEGEVNGYVWQSNACLNCHPDGREDD